ncbi:MAG: undecaprenyl/decaprenyl-phosphate alpha-N-acetylglucosaminyl 1-phosphate transferase [Parcubacteria group bacterium]|nr:undecaprenyl/decaprenyl-phosphate alpha-N-acetylglucosaminyl 1-phosphate transferase [Parcubacteria group bacterium]
MISSISLSYGIIIIVSFLATFCSIPFIKKFCRTHNLIDDAKKDHLKIHKNPTPLLGGLAMLTGFICASIIFLFVQKYFLESSFPVLINQYITLMIGACVAWVFGFWDDIKWQVRILANPKIKLVSQIVLGGLLVGLLLQAGFLWQISTSLIIGLFISLIYFLAIINASNIQDGLDGLFGGIALLSGVGFLIVSYNAHNFIAQLIALSIIGCCLAFLFYNFNPASIFMGDNGSYFLAFLLTVLALIFTSLSNLRMTLGALLIVGLPLVNECFVVGRRLLRGQSPLTGDRKHIYDIMHLKLQSVKKTVIINYILHAIFVSIGIILMV